MPIEPKSDPMKTSYEPSSPSTERPPEDDATSLPSTEGKPPGLTGSVPLPGEVPDVSEIGEPPRTADLSKALGSFVDATKSKPHEIPTEFESEEWPESVSEDRYYGRKALKWLSYLFGIPLITRLIAKMITYPGAYASVIMPGVEAERVKAKAQLAKEFPKAKSITLKTPDGESLDGMFIPANGDFDPKKPTVVYFTGNADFYEHHSSLAQFYSELGMNVLLFNRRGYGESMVAPIPTAQ